MNPELGPRVNRRRLAWLLAAASLVAGVGLAAAVLEPPRIGATTLLVLAQFTPDPRCGHPLGQLATLARGEGLPDEPCLAELATAPFVRPLLVRLVRDGSKPMPVRSTALAALTAGQRAPAGLLESLVVAPSSPPALRRAAWDVATRGPDQTAWVERASSVAVHGLYDRAAARLYAEGAGTALGAARALAARPSGAPDLRVLRDVYTGLGIQPEQLAEGVRRHAVGQMPLKMPRDWANAFWRHGCEDQCVPLVLELLAIEAQRGGEEASPGAAAAPHADAAIAVLYADGERADHVREELAVVARWITRGDEVRRADRLVAAVLHPGAAATTPAEALAEAGDPHAVLVRGAGTPGATALVAAELAHAARVPLAAWLTETGVALRVGTRGASELLHRVDPCSAVSTASVLDPRWRAVPEDGIEALALVEGAARALREGNLEAARRGVDAAGAAWAAAPGLGGVTAAVLAMETAPIAASAEERADTAAQTLADAAAIWPEAVVGVPGPGALFVSRPAWPPPKRGHRPVAAFDLRPAARGAVLERLAEIRALTEDPEDRVRAAWWAAHAGDSELARRLLVMPTEGVRSALATVLWKAVARAVGEPVGEPAAAPVTAASVAGAGVAPGAAAGPELAGGPVAGVDTAVDAPPPDATLPCAAPFRADPPMWAWAGGSPTGRPPTER